MSDFAHINTFIHIHCLHMVINVDRRIEPHVLTAFHFNWHWTGIVDRCVFKVTFGGGELSRDQFYLVFITLIKKYDRGGQTSQPILIYFMLSTDLLIRHVWEHQSLTSLFFWHAMQHRFVGSYWCFGTTYWSHLQGSGSPNTWNLGCLKDGTNRFPWNTSNKRPVYTT